MAGGARGGYRARASRSAGRDAEQPRRRPPGPLPPPVHAAAQRPAVLRQASPRAPLVLVQFPPLAALSLVQTASLRVAVLPHAPPLLRLVNPAHRHARLLAHRPPGRNPLPLDLALAAVSGIALRPIERLLERCRPPARTTEPVVLHPLLAADLPLLTFVRLGPPRQLELRLAQRRRTAVLARHPVHMHMRRRAVAVRDHHRLPIRDAERLQAGAGRVEHRRPLRRLSLGPRQRVVQHRPRSRPSPPSAAPPPVDRPSPG